MKKRNDWDSMIIKAKMRDTEFKDKNENIDHDLIAYDVSRDRKRKTK